MEIRNAQEKDKDTILEFCKFTFSWGDYIQDVWDDWLSEGNLLVLIEKERAVAICHAFILKNVAKVWIEGIRVNPNFRKKGYATKLVEKSEEIAKNFRCITSNMLIESNNFRSLNLAEKLNYTRSELWNFYSLPPKKRQMDNSITTPHLDEAQNILSDKSHYVRSWRWIPFEKSEISFLVKNKYIFISKTDNSIDYIVTVVPSDHFAKTILVTLIEETKTGLKKIFDFLQNMAYENGYERIQILTRKNLEYQDLEKRLSFHLMEKKLV